MDKIEKIRKRPLRSVWKNEAHDFTPWLCANMDYLSEQLGLNISNPVSEAQSENFKVDIQAESDNGPVVIENQFGPSNHLPTGLRSTQKSQYGLSKKRERNISMPATGLMKRTVAALFILSVSKSFR